MLKRTLLRLSAVALVSLPLLAQAETVKQEAAEHPRIVKAIHELEDAIKYLEAAPHTFGGHKAKAIADSRSAVVQLKEALKYRAIQDSKK
jgi:alpha-D-ribose 1-methylphosphonate 5-triphosphate synthase subunit PhnL